MCNTKGRLCQGLPANSEYPDNAAQEAYLRIADQMTRYHATRGLFAGPRLYKEFMRGGFEGPCLDFDISKSSPRAMNHRYPDLKPIEYWTKAPEKFANDCGVSVELTKEFVNGCVGCGDNFIQKWLDDASLTSLPQLLEAYKEATDQVLKRDKDAFPELLEKIMSNGHDERNASCKLTFVKNSEYERPKLDGAIAYLKEHGSIVSVESDGTVVMPSKQLSSTSLLLWKGKLINLMKSEFPDFKYKPYRPKKELLEEMMAKWAVS